MNVSIHQPQYLPWWPYLLKIEESDTFILLDSVDFQKNGLQNRNQIKTAQGAQWLTVPVKQRLGQKINEVELDANVNWRKKHWQTIQQNYRKAGAFDQYAGELEQLYVREWTSLNDLAIAYLEMTLRWLGIERTVLRSSQMRSTGHASELVLNLCIEAGARRYVSGMGGRNYLNEAAFQDAGIEIVYRAPILPRPYPQQHPQAGFIDSLSALDLVLNCGSDWRRYVSNVTVAS
jgi:hypothetical protein